MDAEGDGRDRGPALLRARRRRLRGHRARALARTSRPARSSRAARRSRSSSSATSTSRPRAHARAQDQGGVPRDRARAKPGRRTGSSTTYLNPVSYGNHAYGVEAAAQTYFSKPAEELTLPQAALLAGLPQAPSRLRPVPQPGRRARAGATRCSTRCSTTGYITPRAVRRRRSRRGPRAQARASSTREIREPYFFDYVRDQLIERVRRQHRPHGRAARLHDDRPALQRAGAKAIRDDALLRRRPRRRRSSRSTRRTAPSGRWAVKPGTHGQPVQPRRAGAPPARLDVQDLRARPTAIDAGDRPVLDLLRLGAVPLPARSADCGPLGGADLRPLATRARSSISERDARAPTTRSSRSSRSTSARRTSPRWRTTLGISAHARRAVARRSASASIGVSPLEMANAYATLAAGGDLLEADRDPQGRSSRTARSTRTPAGASRSASASSPTGSPTR